MQNTPPPPGQPPYNGGGFPPPPDQPSYGGFPPPAGQQPPYGTPVQPQPPYAPPPNYGYPPPAYGYGAPVPPPRPRRLSRVVLLAIVLVLAVPLLACIFGFGFLISGGISNKNEAEKALAGFMSAVAAGDTDTAYNLLAPNLQNRYPRADFKKTYIDTLPEYRKYFERLDGGNNFSYNINNGQESISFSGTAYFKDRGQRSYQATMIKAYGGWLVSNLSLDDAT